MNDLQPAADVKRALDRLIAAFFAAVSFEAEQPPDYEQLHELFIAEGLLINNTGTGPEISNVEQFIDRRQATFRTGEVSRYRVEELSETTETFGSIAHRASAFVRSGTRGGSAFESRGMIFTQFVLTAAGWRVSAAAWDDQRPGQVLSGHAEPTEFG